jgi:hypothetical protein
MRSINEMKMLFEGEIMKTLAISTVCLSVLVASVGLTGCAEPYGTVGYVGPGYYGSGSYGPGYYPGYASTGYVSIAVGDRPYYTRGAGYWVGPHYYGWRHGYWHRYHGRRVWIHGNYVVRQ